LALLLYAWWVEPDWIEVKEHDRKHAQVQEPIRVGELSALYLTEIGWTLDSHQGLCIRVEKFYLVEFERILGSYPQYENSQSHGLANELVLRLVFLDILLA